MTRASLLLTAALALGLSGSLRAAEGAATAQPQPALSSPTQAQAGKKVDAETAISTKSKKEAEESCCCDGTCGETRKITWSPRGKELWGK